MKKTLLLLFIAFCTLGYTASASDLNPLATDRADTVGKGNLRVDLYFSVDSLPDGSLVQHTPGFGLTWGLSDKVDFFMKYTGFMMRHWPDESESSGSGDITTGLKVSPWTGPWGRLGFSIATKLPNADDTYGLGTDEQDFFVNALYTATIKNLKINLNAGLAIVGDNAQLRSYDYLFAYGVGLEYMIGEHWSIVTDINGTTGGREGTDTAKVELGLVGPIGWGWEWAVTGSYGLTPYTPEWSAGLYFSKTWGVGPNAPGPFYTDETPLRISYYPFPMETMEAWTVKNRTVYTSFWGSAAGYEDGSMLYDVFGKDFRVGVADGVDIGFKGSYFLLEDSPIFDDSVGGTGDLHVNFKISPWQVGIFRFGFLSDVKLSTGNYNEGIDSGKMDYNFLALGSVSYKKLTAHMNLGFAIEGNPIGYSSQNDLIVAAIGAEYAITDRVSIFGEFYSKLGEVDTSSYLAGGGVRFMIGKFAVYMSGATGFADNDPDWKASIGIMRLWDL